jgi:DNA polymerase/3'-5' exonuclease PolX
MELLQAREIAVAAGKLLQPHCDRINIAGGIRRQKDDPHDIELVAQPKVKILELSDLFGELQKEEKIVDEFVSVANGLGKVIKGKPTGRYMQIALKEGINLDLFMPRPGDYIRQYVIRTGSADYVKMMIAYGWKKKGWCGTEDGLRKISQCTEKKLPDGKSKWICESKDPELPPDFENETDFFKWLDVPYRNPIYRHM